MLRRLINFLLIKTYIAFNLQFVIYCALLIDQTVLLIKILSYTILILISVNTIGITLELYTQVSNSYS